MNRLYRWLTQEGGFDRVMVSLFLFTVCLWIGMMAVTCIKTFSLP